MALCKRALAVDPYNQIVLATLEQAEVRQKKLDRAREFEKVGNLDLAESEYQSLLKERRDDLEARLALIKICERRIDLGEHVPKSYIRQLEKTRPMVRSVN